MADQPESSKVAQQTKPADPQPSCSTDGTQTPDFSASSSQPWSATSPHQEEPSTAARDGPGATPFFNPWYPWVLNSVALGSQPDVAPLNGVRFDQACFIPPPMFPLLHPTPFPGYFQIPQLNEQQHQNGGVFAVPLVPMIGPVAAFPPGGLIPLSYNPPLNTSSSVDGTAQATSSSVPRSSEPAPAEVQEGAPVDGLRNRHAPPARGAEPPRQEAQRQIVRRFHVQLDLLLILKLAVVVFIFNQDGSRDRLLLLLFLAGLVYLYQTGALSPVLQWISQSAQRAMMPPQQPPQAGRGQAGPEVQGPDGGVNAQNEREAAENAPPGAEAEAGAVPALDAAIRPGADAARDGAGEDPAQRAAQGPNRWGFFKEVQMLLVGFVTSLLPGFQHVD